MRNEKLQQWFGLSYASWLVMPRVLMCEMPEEWQEKMATLLEEFDNEYPNQPKLSFYVQAKGDDNKFTSLPGWLCNYRYPDHEKIQEAKGIK